MIFVVTNVNTVLVCVLSVLSSFLHSLESTKVTHNEHVSTAHACSHENTFPQQHSVSHFNCKLLFDVAVFRNSISTVFTCFFFYVHLLRHGVLCRGSQSGGSPCRLNGLKMAGRFSFIFCECFQACRIGLEPHCSSHVPLPRTIFCGSILVDNL